MSVHRTTRALVASLWSLNSASRSCSVLEGLSQAQKLSWWLNTYPLKYLFSPNIHQSTVELLDLAHDALYLALVVAFNLASCSNCQVQRQLDSSHTSPSP